MPETKSVPLAQLREYRAELGGLPRLWQHWNRYEAWSTKVRIFLRRHFPQDLQDFEQLAKQPGWYELTLWTVDGRPANHDEQIRQNQINNKLLLDSNERLIAFMDTLIKETSTQSEGGNPQPMPYQEDRPMPDPKRVFVIYGRNEPAYHQMVLFLRALKLNPKSFFEVSAECGANATVLEIVRHGMEQAAGVVALFTADEWAVLRPAFDPTRGTGEESRRWQARPNVIFEAGLALGIAEERTVLVRLGRDVKLFSDVGGIHLVNLDNGHESRNLLRGKLRTAGCQPDMETGDHLHVTQAGDFEACIRMPEEQLPGDPFLLPDAPAAKRGRKK